jgi:colanic acid biosynthesis glycosyl transferase WcaI
MKKPKLNILVYGYNYAPEPTGIGKYSGEMARWLKERGHRVEVMTALPHYPAWKIDEAYRGKGFFREVRDGIEVLRTPLYMPPSQQRTALKRMLLDTSFTVNSLWWWLPLAVTKRFDVVVAICPSVQSGMFPYLYQVFRGVPWVFHIQDLQVDAAHRLGLIKNKVVVTLLHGLEEFLLKRASVVSTITESMRRRVLEKGVEARRTILFPNWADITFVTPGPRLNKLRETIGIGADKTVLLYSGSMGEKQGLELILEAAEKLRGLEQLVFVMVGEGGTRSAHSTTFVFLTSSLGRMFPSC